MGMVRAKEPFVASSENGPVGIDTKTPYDENDPLVERFPQFFASDEELAERGEGKNVNSVQVTNNGQRGRVK
jgi:hypothetical protein